jgi:hypothetical protein
MKSCEKHMLLHKSLGNLIKAADSIDQGKEESGVRVQGKE